MQSNPRKFSVKILSIRGVGLEVALVLILALIAASPRHRPARIRGAARLTVCSATPATGPLAASRAIGEPNRTLIFLGSATRTVITNDIGALTVNSMNFPGSNYVLRSCAPPCVRQRGKSETMNQNSHCTWIEKLGLVRFSP